MDFLKLAETRQSDRAFDPTLPVAPEQVEHILQAALMAPSACNAQPWHLIVVDERTKCDAISEALASMGMNKFASQAPLHILIVEERPNLTSWIGGLLKNKHFPLIDCGIVASHITLAATDEGLGSCILGWFDEKRIRKILDIPSSKRVLLDVVIGHPLGEHRTKIRKPIQEKASYNRY